jgi:hypothetical protein
VDFKFFFFHNFWRSECGKNSGSGTQLYCSHIDYKPYFMWHLGGYVDFQLIFFYNFTNFGDRKLQVILNPEHNYKSYQL